MGRDAAVAVFRLEQRLRDDRADRFRQHRAHHVFLSRRKNVDDAVNGLGRGAGVQGAEHEVAGFRRRQRQANGLQIAHLADQDHVRILAQGRAQCVVERKRMRTDFALIDQALLRFMHEFDRVLDRQNVAVLVFIDMIDHRRQGGRLAGPGRPGNQNDAARLVGDVAETLGRVQFLKRQDFRGNGPHHRAGAAVLHEGIDPETCQIGNRERKIAFEILLVCLALTIVHDVVDHAVHLGMIHRRQVDASYVTVHPDHRRQAG